MGKNMHIFNVFYDVNEFYICQQKLLHSANELLTENCRYVNNDIYIEP